MTTTADHNMETTTQYKQNTQIGHSASTKKKNRFLALIKWPKKKKRDWKQNSLQDVTTDLSEPDWLPGGLKAIDISGVRRRQLAAEVNDRPTSMLEGHSWARRGSLTGVTRANEFGRKRQAPVPSEKELSEKSQAFQKNDGPLVKPREGYSQMSSFGSSPNCGLGASKWLSQSVPCLADNNDKLTVTNMEDFELDEIPEEQMSPSPGLQPHLTTFWQDNEPSNSSQNSEKHQLPTLESLLPPPPKSMPPIEILRYMLDKSVGTESELEFPINQSDKSTSSTPASPSANCNRISSRRESECTTEELDMMFEMVIAEGEKTLVQSQGNTAHNLIENNEVVIATFGPGAKKESNIDINEQPCTPTTVTPQLQPQNSSLIEKSSHIHLEAVVEDTTETFSTAEVRRRRPQHSYLEERPVPTLESTKTVRPTSVTIVRTTPQKKKYASVAEDSDSDIDDESTKETLLSQRGVGHSHSYLVVDSDELSPTRRVSAPSDVPYKEELDSLRRDVLRIEKDIASRNSKAESLSEVDVGVLREQYKSQQTEITMLHRRIEDLTSANNSKFVRSTSLMSNPQDHHHLERISETFPTDSSELQSSGRRPISIVTATPSWRSQGNSHTDPGVVTAKGQTGPWVEVVPTPVERNTTDRRQESQVTSVPSRVYGNIQNSYQGKTPTFKISGKAKLPTKVNGAPSCEDQIPSRKGEIPKVIKNEKEGPPPTIPKPSKPVPKVAPKPSEHAINASKRPLHLRPKSMSNSNPSELIDSSRKCDPDLNVNLGSRNSHQNRIITVNSKKL